MTFSKPYPGTFAYEGTITSQSMNYINDNFPSILDKTGDNVGNGGGISGQIDVLSGGSIHVLTGGQIVYNGGSLTYNSGTLVFNGTSGVTFNDTAGITFAGTGDFIMGTGSSFLTAGNVNITSGAQLNVASGGAMSFQSGSITQVEGGAFFYIGSGGDVEAVSGSIINFTGSNFTIDTGTTTVDGGILVIQGGATVSTSGSGFITIASGGTFTAASGSTAQFAAFPTFIVPQTRSICESPLSGVPISGSWAYGLQFVYDTSTGGVFAKNLDRCHNGATLNQLFVNFAVGTGHSAVPANRPNLSLIRYAYNSMFSSQTLSTTDPQYFPNPGSGAAYYNSGNQQYMNYVCNQNNVIDNTTYVYVLTIVDESGANSQINNAFGTIRMQFQNIPNLSWNT